MSIEIKPNPASAGGVTGGLVYKGSYNATTNTPDLTSSTKGDFYIVSVAGTLAGVALNVGDHIVFNQDASSPLTSAMFDVIDNTDAVQTVNGLTGSVVLNLKTLNDVNATLTPSDSTFLVGDGSEWIGESGATARTSLGLAIGTDVQAFDAQLTDVAGLTPADGAFIVGDGSNFVTETLGTARTSLGLGSAATLEAGANTANQLVQLTAAGKLPAVDGSLLTNISATDSTRLLKTDNLSDLANAATARTNLGVAIGSDVQAFDAQLTDIAGLTPTDSHIIVGDGSNFVTESGATARTSLGLAIGTDVQAFDAQLTDVAGLTPADGAFIVGDGSNFVTETLGTARTSLGLGSAATLEAGANTANQLVQLTAAGKLPAVDGSLLTNISATDSTRLLKTDNLSDLANAATARTNLGVAIGSDVQAFDAQLTDIAGLTPTDSHIIVGDGSNFVTESGATARTSLGLAIGSDVQAYDAQLADVAGLTPADGAFIVGDGSNFVTESGATARTSLNLGTVATLDVGTGANNVVQLDASSRLPAVDGSQLTNVTATETDTLNDVVGRGATTSTPITVGDLKINSNAAGTSTSGSIATLASNNNIKLDPHGSGKPELVGNATRGSGQIQFNCEQNSHGIILKGPPHSAGASYTMILPDSLGSNGQVLSLQDASTGELTFSTSGAGDLLASNNLNDVADAAAARGNLGLTIGTNVQAFDAQLTDVAGLTPTDGNIIIGNGSNFITESGATARTSLGVAIGSDVQAYDAQLADIAGLTPTDSHIIVGDGSNFVTESGATARTSLGLAIGTDVQAYDAQLADVAGLTPSDGGFIVGDGSNFVLESGATARTSLNLGTVATLDVGTGANNVVQLDGSSRLPAVDGSQLTNLPSGGGLTYQARNTTAHSPLTPAANYHYSINANSATFVINLPALSSVTDGDQIRVKFQARGNAAYDITINRSGSDTIDGQTAITLDVLYSSVTLVAGSTEWEIV